MIASFAVQKLLNLMQLSFSIFAYISCAFGVISKYSLSTQVSRKRHSMFPSSNFAVQKHDKTSKKAKRQGNLLSNEYVYYLDCGSSN
jgi:hypothetical protein